MKTLSTTRPDPRRPYGVPDPAAVAAHCAMGRWQAAYSAARGCPRLADVIEEAKAAALAALRARWEAGWRPGQW